VITVRPCPAHPGAVDVVDIRPTEHDGLTETQIHVAPGEWAEFLAAAKAGKFDGAPPVAPGQV
jgi:hypothetical protein